MNSWPVQKAKAHFSELFDACLKESPQMVTRQGVEVAVLVSAAEWTQLNLAARPSLKELLLSSTARTEFVVPPRGSARKRTAASL